MREKGLAARLAGSKRRLRKKAATGKEEEGDASPFLSGVVGTGDSNLPLSLLCLSPPPSPAEPFVLRRPPPPPPPPQPERERERRPALALFPGDVLGGGDWTGDDGGGGGSPFSRKPSLSCALKRRRRKLAFAEPVSASVEERKMSVLEDGLERRKNRELAFAFREGHPNF